jgi:hypothetical protein
MTPFVNECSINGSTYRIQKMDVMRQFHVARRLAPVLSGVIDALKAGGLDPVKLAAMPDTTAKMDIDPFAMVEPLGKVLAHISDEDSEYIIGVCLSCVTRAQAGGTGYAPVWVAKGGLMFADMQLPEMLQLVWKVLESNLMGFFSGRDSPSSAASPPYSRRSP